MIIRLENQLNKLYKHKPQLVAPIINTVVHEIKDGDVVVAIPAKVVVVAIPAKVVVAKIMEALSKTTLVPITIQVQITLGAENVVAEDDEACIINQMWSVMSAINAAIMQMNADQKVIIMLPIVLKKTVITNKMKRIMHY